MTSQWNGWQKGLLVLGNGGVGEGGEIEEVLVYRPVVENKHNTKNVHKDKNCLLFAKDGS